MYYDDAPGAKKITAEADPDVGVSAQVENEGQKMKKKSL